MALLPEQLLIAEVVGYEPVTDDEGTQQYPADVDFQDAPKGAIPCTGNVYKNKLCVNPSKANGMASMKFLMPNAMLVITTTNVM